MMHQGGIVLDKAGEEKQAVQMDDILRSSTRSASSAATDMKEILRTDRLLLRELTEGDLDDLRGAFAGQARHVRL